MSARLELKLVVINGTLVEVVIVYREARLPTPHVGHRAAAIELRPDVAIELRPLIVSWWFPSGRSGSRWADLPVSIGCDRKGSIPICGRIPFRGARRGRRQVWIGGAQRGRPQVWTGRFRGISIPLDKVRYLGHRQVVVFLQAFQVAPFLV